MYHAYVKLVLNCFRFHFILFPAFYLPTKAFRPSPQREHWKPKVYSTLSREKSGCVYMCFVNTKCVCETFHVCCVECLNVFVEQVCLCLYVCVCVCTCVCVHVCVCGMRCAVCVVCTYMCMCTCVVCVRVCVYAWQLSYVHVLCEYNVCMSWMCYA